jgi:hypothetical protein
MARSVLTHNRSWGLAILLLDQYMAGVAANVHRHASRKLKK